MLYDFVHFMTQTFKREYHKTDVVLSPPDEFHPWVGEDAILALSLASEPQSYEIRRMFLELRRTFRWSRSFAAAVLGVTKGTVAKWESGKRTPSASAAKLIFLLHAQMFNGKKKVKNAWDLATWGRIQCRDSIPQAIAIGSTLFLSQGEWKELTTSPEQFVAKFAAEHPIYQEP